MHQSPQDPDQLRAAFRDVHAARLHGFALVLVMGDRAAAAVLASETLQHLSADAPRLRHPERAAAELRAELYRRTRRLRIPRLPDEAGRAALARLGIGGSTATALAALSLADRAALLAVEIERFGEDDAATILRTDAAHARRLATQARNHYLEKYAGADGPLPPVPGSIGERVAALAHRAMGAGG